MALTTQLIFVVLAIIQRQKIHDEANNIAPEALNGCFDYIVVGLGTAGPIVAKRLAENPNVKVLGLEAGGPQNLYTDIPAQYPFGLALTEIDWQFVTVPQTRMGFAYPNHQLAQSRGKIFGGTAAINYMIYNRGNRRAYDTWESEFGATGWNFEGVLPFFIKNENMTNQLVLQQSPGYHGTKGPNQITIPKNVDPALLISNDAINSYLNVTGPIDYNGPEQIGTAISHMNIGLSGRFGGIRETTSNTYCEPNPFPDNLFISLWSWVTKLIIENGVVVGVEVVKHNITYRAYATIEVIVCAGVIKTPQLLQLSGIGPKELLDKFDIPVVSDVPAGKHHHDHLIIYEQYAICKNYYDVITPNPPPFLTIPDLYSLFANQSGVLSQVPFRLNYYSTKWDYEHGDPAWPSAALWASSQYWLLPLSAYYFKYDQSLWPLWNEYYSQFLNKSAVFFAPFVGRCWSEGTIYINSTNPFDKPLIQPNALMNNTDFENFMEVTKFGFKIIESLPDTFYLPGPIPRCSYCPGINVSDCTSYHECMIRQIGHSRGHSKLGTCRMGDINRSDVVVGPDCKVKGVQNVRVCDTSIAPLMPNSNVLAMAMMIGEKCANIVKSDKRYPPGAPSYGS